MPGFGTETYLKAMVLGRLRHPFQSPSISVSQTLMARKRQ